MLKALGSVLGHHIQALIPKEEIYIEQAIQRLKSQKKGRTSFLSSLPSVSVSLSLKDQLKTYPAVICFLDEKVSLNFYTEAWKSLLGQTVVISNLNAAFDLKKQFS